MFKIQAFWYFKIFLFWKQKHPPKTIITNFLHKQPQINLAPPKFSHINPGGSVFSSLTQNIHIAHIDLQTNSLIILFVSFQSLNRFLNTLCGNEFYWRLKIYKDFLETPTNIFNMPCLQNAVRAVFKHEQEREAQEEIGNLPEHF